MVDRAKTLGLVALLGLGAVAAGGLYACGGDETPAPAPVPAPEPAVEAPTTPVPTVLMVQSQFVGGKPGPARMTLWRHHADQWFEEVIEDPDSALFHKAVVWRSGILTIGQGMPATDPPKEAKLSHWTRDGDGWKEKVLWKRAWDGKFQRFRDMEFGDFDGDGKQEIAIATHDKGVVAVVDEQEDGSWKAVEMDEKADTFVHEIEAGDVDGDGTAEFYATPSERNKSSGVSQAGGVVRYDLKGGAYVRSDVVHWDNTHAKEILVSDVDGDGKLELYAVREAVVVKEGGKKVRKEPVTILRYDMEGSAWKETVVATIDDDQTRFVTAGDLDGDGKVDLLAAAYTSGLWMLKPKGDGTFENVLIDKNSGGFEHAAHVADLDGDGKVEIYAAADKQRELRVYTWDGETFDRKKIASMPKGRITWNLQDGKI